jgi:phosphate transport system permease protein
MNDIATRDEAPSGDSGSPRVPDPRRFEASRWVLFVDAFMNRFIRVGGIAVVVAVIGIFVFIVSQVVPMFRSARIDLNGAVASRVALPAGDYLAIASDEWGERPLALRSDGRLYASDLTEGGLVTESSLDFLAGESITSANAQPGSGVIAIGTSGGKVHLLDYSYETTFEGGKRRIREKVAKGFTGSFAGAVREVAFGQSGAARLIAVHLEPTAGDAAPGASAPGASALPGKQLLVKLIERKRSLVGSGTWKETGTADLSGTLRPGVALESLHVSNRADSLVVVYANGEVDYHFRTGNGVAFELRQSFRPFKELDDPSIGEAGFLFGDVSLVFLSKGGENRVFSLFRSDEEPVRIFHRTKDFPALPEDGNGTIYAKSLRNKTFLVGSGSRVSLRHATTEKVRWEGDLPFPVRHAFIGAKYDSLLFFGEDRRFHRVLLDDPHPEISLKALFGKVWYEGSPEPKHEWQSTGGSDDFEPKLSLVPLIFGTLKGTFYALLFAMPIALFGAVYTSEFLHPRNKVYVKPVMEIMASLPSVVLGFLAALWLAPILERRVPSILCLAILLPAASFFIGWFWSRRPQSVRKFVPPGREFLYFTPVLLLILFGGWHLGPMLEQLLFAVKDPTTGERIGDFTRWWPAVTGTAYEQRNSLVVGFVMGFAVIPIIFTIAEDSLSNVPGALRSGSLALGASRWQTAWRVVLPTASAGIFSAVMIGLGRAVGETMIVVMATGNTPIMEWNVFSGMRTLSANIAVELPEAPHHGTLYRTLFLGAVALFVMTFAVNTVAEVLRQHLRERYKTV